MAKYSTYIIENRQKIKIRNRETLEIEETNAGFCGIEVNQDGRIISLFAKSSDKMKSYPHSRYDFLVEV